ncbi:hypothetical protein Glove_123g63 [Diversispora epigaea]|uniref:Uncharacterized protein n=1 Tax=Diversispora epigaea TaxID=1348612 RepID=A0A397J8S4_9GLOM|nr:hypothetical protein Glove_123g63 [Diversispora epigaea]
MKKVKSFLKLFQPRRPHFPDQSPNEDSLPYKIGSNIMIKEYNKFLERKESSGYKYQRENNGDVFIVDMSDPEHGRTVSLLQRYFNTPNNNINVDPLIDVGTDEFHFSPSGTGELIAPDVSVYPNMNHVQQPRIPYPGPPPGDKNCQLWMNQVYVRYVLGIKFHRKRNTRNDQGQYHRSMTAKLWQQGIVNPREWEFGTHQRGNNIPIACNAPGLPLFRIDIPVAQVFWDPPIPAVARYTPRVPPPLANALVNFSIDLYSIQQLVLRMQNNL